LRRPAKRRQAILAAVRPPNGPPLFPLFFLNIRRIKHRQPAKPHNNDELKPARRIFRLRLIARRNCAAQIFML
jgi:hypothetical protein